jgi:hypothetical protein
VSPPAAAPDGVGESRPPSTVPEALALTHEWFHRHSGWAPPDEETLAEWVADGVCRCPDDCIVAPEQWCGHGLASWSLVLEAQALADQLARDRQELPGRPGSKS